MSFKKKSNETDRWENYSRTRLDAIQSVGFIDPNSLSVTAFTNFLTYGEDKSNKYKMTDLTDEQFLILESIVSPFFPDMQHDDPLTQYRSQRLSRFGRYR